MYRTVIVEDDPMIASINQTFLSRDPRFSLAAVFHSGQEALEWLRKRPVELLILDVYMPRMSGLELLRELRAEEITLDVIMVTAANDSKTVDAHLLPPAGGHLRPRQRQPGGPGRHALQRPQRRPRPQGAAAAHPGPGAGVPGPGAPGGLHL